MSFSPPSAAKTSRDFGVHLDDPPLRVADGDRPLKLLVPFECAHDGSFLPLYTIATSALAI